MAGERAQGANGSLRCSFCFKSQDQVSKTDLQSRQEAKQRLHLRRMHATCASILEDDAEGRSRETSEGGELLQALDRWIAKESSGGDATEELAKCVKQLCGCCTQLDNRYLQ